MSSLAEEARSVLASLGTSPNKRFSQNFMVDAQALSSVAELILTEAGRLGSSEVLEIGPGLGFLTRRLIARGFRVTAVEKDRRLAAHLSKIYAPENLTVIRADLLKFDLDGHDGIIGPVCVVGNIPYSITTPIFEWIIDRRHRILKAVLTVQREVAEWVTAKPGGKAWGALSVFMQFYGDVRIERKIGRNSFLPCPSVDSAVLGMDILKDGRFAVKNQKTFFHVVHTAFQHRRKTIENALSMKYSGFIGKTKKQMCPFFEKAGICPSQRPETLTLEQWARLADLIEGD